MSYRENAKRDFLILIKKLRDQDPEIKKIPLSVIEEKIDSIIENIVNEAVARTITKFRMMDRM